MGNQKPRPRSGKTKHSLLEVPTISKMNQMKKADLVVVGKNMGEEIVKLRSQIASSSSKLNKANQVYSKVKEALEKSNSELASKKELLTRSRNSFNRVSSKVDFLEEELDTKDKLYRDTKDARQRATAALNSVCNYGFWTFIQLAFTSAKVRKEHFKNL